MLSKYAKTKIAADKEVWKRVKTMKSYHVYIIHQGSKCRI